MKKLVRSAKLIKIIGSGAEYNMETKYFVMQASQVSPNIWIVYRDNRPFCVSWYDDKMNLHRRDGPAKRFSDGTKSYWVHGGNITEGQLNAIQAFIKY